VQNFKCEAPYSQATKWYNLLPLSNVTKKIEPYKNITMNMSVGYFKNGMKCISRSFSGGKNGEIGPPTIEIQPAIKRAGEIIKLRFLKD